MKSRFAVPIISLILVLLVVVSAFVAVSLEKKQDVRLTKKDVTFSDIVVDGKEMLITIKAANSSGIQIKNTTFVCEDGVLKFKVFGNKNVEIGEDDGKVHSATLSMTAQTDIKEIKFLSINDKGEEEEISQSFKRGAID